MKKLLIVSIMLLITSSLYAKDWIIREKGYTYKFNPEKKYFEYYSPRGRKIANIYFFDNGPDYYSEGLRRTVRNNKIGFINRKNIVVIRAEFDFAFPFRNGYALVIKDPVYEKMGEHTAVHGGKYGLVNRQGRLVVPMKYDDISEWSYNTGKAVVYLKGKKITLKIK